MKKQVVLLSFIVALILIVSENSYANGFICSARCVRNGIVCKEQCDRSYTPNTDSHNLCLVKCVIDSGLCLDDCDQRYSRRTRDAKLPFLRIINVSKETFKFSIMDPGKGTYEDRELSAEKNGKYSSKTGSKFLKNLRAVYHAVDAL